MKISTEEIRQAAQDIREQMIMDRRRLHQIPEIGTDLPQTSAYVKERLDAMGISWQDCGGPLPEKMIRDYMTAGFPADGERNRRSSPPSAAEAPVFFCGRTWTPFPSGKIMTLISSQKMALDTCAVTTRTPPCSLERRRF